MGQRQNYRTTAEPATHSAVVAAVMFAERFNAEKGEEAETQNRTWTLGFGMSVGLRQLWHHRRAGSYLTCSCIQLCMVTSGLKGPVRQLYCHLVVRKHISAADHVCSGILTSQISLLAAVMSAG